MSAEVHAKPGNSPGAGVDGGRVLLDSDGVSRVAGFVEAAADHRVRGFQAGGDPLGVPVIEHGVDGSGQVRAVPGGDYDEPVTQAEDGPVQ